MKISFKLVEDHLRFTHFIEPSGDIIACKPLEKCYEEVRVGIVNKTEYPTDEQRLSMCHLARLATGLDPTIEIEFGEACSPFLALYQKGHPLTDLLCG